MAKKNIKLSDLPEEVTQDGVKVYGTTSYETQIAILSQYLHTLKGKHDKVSGEKLQIIIEAICDYIDFKRQHDKSNPIWKEIAKEEITSMFKEEMPLQYELFSDFSMFHSLRLKTLNSLLLTCSLVWADSV